MKERLDILLMQRNFAGSRAKAKAIIQSGIVYVDGKLQGKAGAMIEDTGNIEIKGEPLRYVSRGGLKLEKAIEKFSIELEGKICMDVGASTGGFTDCMLQNGAGKVYAIDVGQNQLDEMLRRDKRVVSMEKTNIRYMVPEDMTEDITFVSIDVSFISLTKILLPVYHLLAMQGEVVCLIKPQFEAGKEKVGKKGVVKDKKIHDKVIQTVVDYAIKIGFQILNLDFSPVKGPEGNIEYLLYLRKTEPYLEDAHQILDIHGVVEASHGMLDNKEKR